MRFKGDDLKKTEESSWIFATTAKAFVGGKFLDGPFTLPGINRTPVDLSPASTYQSPYLNGNPAAPASR